MLLVFLKSARTISSNIICCIRNRFYKCSSNILEFVLEFNTFGHCNTILCNLGRAICLLYHNSTALTFTRTVSTDKVNKNYKGSSTQKGRILAESQQSLNNFLQSMISNASKILIRQSIIIDYSEQSQKPPLNILASAVLCPNIAT